MVIAFVKIFISKIRGEKLIKVQGKDFGAYLTHIQLKLVRTYKGEIKRTQTGKVAAFPLSFITPGFSLEFLGPREQMKLLQQLVLSDDLVELILTYDGTTIKGKFSCTDNEYIEVRDRNEKSMTLRLNVVSDGSSITKENGTLFAIKTASTTLLAGCSFGKVYTVPGTTTYTLDGAKLPSGKVLVLGDTLLVAVS